MNRWNLYVGRARVYSVQNFLLQAYREYNVLLVLFKCQGRSVMLREELRLRMFENRVLKMVPGPERVGMTGGWGN